MLPFGIESVNSTPLESKETVVNTFPAVGLDFALIFLLLPLGTRCFVVLSPDHSSESMYYQRSLFRNGNFEGPCSKIAIGLDIIPQVIVFVLP